MEAKYTPGPWDKVKRTSDHIYLGTKNKPISEICPLYGAESEANLRLIAAAPELLEALEMAYAHIHTKLYLIRDADKEAISSAIAKAKGKENA